MLERSIICISAYLLSIYCLHAQIPFTPDSLRSSGIYRSFEEFKLNIPSGDLRLYTIDEVGRGYGANKDRKTFIAYELNSTVREKINADSIWGIYDGKDLYRAGTDKKYFYKIDLTGRYSYLQELVPVPAKIHKTAMVPTPSGYTIVRNYAENREYNVEEKIIDLLTGEEYLVKKKLESILKKDTELYKAYKEDCDKEVKSLFYIKEYSARSNQAVNKGQD